MGTFTISLFYQTSRKACWWRTIWRFSAFCLFFRVHLAFLVVMPRLLLNQYPESSWLEWWVEILVIPNLPPLPNGLINNVIPIINIFLQGVEPRISLEESSVLSANESVRTFLIRIMLKFFGLQPKIFPSIFLILHSFFW